MNKMYKNLIFVILVVFLAPISSSFGESCEDASNKADNLKILIPSYQSGYKVVNKGRAYFYVAPLEKCKEQSLFLVPGDQLNAYAEYENFTYVMYINPASGKTTEGWLKADRLESTGTGIGPTPQP